MKGQNSNFFVALVVMMSQFGGGCATAIAQVSDREVKTTIDNLVDDEREMIPPGVFDQRGKLVEGVRVAAFPDSLVFSKSDYQGNEAYRKYTEAREVKNSDGSVSMPPAQISVETLRRGIGNVFVSESNVSTCTPNDYRGVKGCSRLKETTVTIVREKPLIMAEREYYAQRFMGKVGMLRITWIDVSVLAEQVQLMKRPRATPGQCDNLDLSVRMSYISRSHFYDGVASKLAGGASYLNYQAVAQANNVLMDYQFALNGCYDDKPTEKATHISKGKALVAKLSSH